MSKFITLLVIVCLFGHSDSNLWGQVIEGGCSSVKVLGFPAYPSVYYTPVGFYLSCREQRDPCIQNPELGCCRIVNGPVFINPPKFYLEEKINGNWVTISGKIFANSGFTFNNLSKGVYRIRVYLPTANTIYCCPRAVGVVTHLYSLNHSYIGLLGGYPPEGEQEGFAIYSNEVLVGPSEQNDIIASFIDPNDNNAFDIGDEVLFDASSSTHYDQWVINIAESGPSSRWTTTGWKIGSQAGIFSIRDLWIQTHGSFAPWHTYEVNFVIENNKCRNTIEWPSQSWNNKKYLFIKCPFGTGCKLGKEDLNFTIAPNPASNFVRFPDINDIWQEGFFISLIDVAGRTLLYEPIRGNDLDISQIPSGMYIVNISRDGNILATKKLIVQK